MRLAYARRETTRPVSYDFMNRQLVWNAFTEFLLFLVPLVNLNRIQSSANNALFWNRIQIQALPPTKYVCNLSPRRCQSRTHHTRQTAGMNIATIAFGLYPESSVVGLILTFL
ncbi:hypothetical protein BJ742DRAFT_351537 [Cladochytrium replicatum]|nr:hypothetical protein BJ742DRAFT_351537 [Cladochytrium replicatum]